MSNFALISNLSNIDFSLFPTNIKGIYQFSNSEEVINSKDFADAFILLKSIDQGLLFSFNTLSCCKYSISDIITKVIIVNYRKAEKLSEALNICLHEAISNAVLYGSFETNNRYNNYEEFLESRLNNDDYLQRRILIEVLDKNDILKIRVKDYGNNGICVDIPEKKYNGNGLKIIQSFASEQTFDENGVLEISFKV